jgi:hypothetical protein
LNRYARLAKAVRFDSFWTGCVALIDLYSKHWRRLDTEKDQAMRPQLDHDDFGSKRSKIMRRSINNLLIPPPNPRRSAAVS